MKRGWEEVGRRSLPLACGSGAVSPALAALDPLLADRRIVFVGESDHFVEETYERRIEVARWLHARGVRWFAEELSPSDGERVGRYLAQPDGDERELERVVATGYEGARRSDRDDRPRQGPLADAAGARPTRGFANAQRRYDRALRALGGVRYFGFDVEYEPRAVYAFLEEAGSRWPGLRPVHGESLARERERVAAAQAHLARDGAAPELRARVRSLETGLRYVEMLRDAADLEALRPAMAFREEVMHEHVDRILDALPAGEGLALFGQALHLSRDDRAWSLPPAAVGPGAARTASVGQHVAARVGRDAIASLWLVDPPARRRWWRPTLNQRLATLGECFVLPVRGAEAERDPLTRPGTLEIMHATPVRVRLPDVADALIVCSEVTRMRA